MKFNLPLFERMNFGPTFGAVLLAVLASSLTAQAQDFPDPNRVYEIKEFTRNERLGIGSDNRIVRWKRTGTAEQRFKFEKHGSKWAIKRADKDLYLTVKSQADGSMWAMPKIKIPIDPIKGTFKVLDNQLFVFDRKNGTNKFRLRESTKNEQVAVGSNGWIVRWSSTNNNDQLFELIADSTTPTKDGNWTLKSSVQENRHEQVITRTLDKSATPKIYLKIGQTAEDKGHGGKARLLTIDNQKSKGLDAQGRHLFYFAKMAGDSSRNRMNVGIAGSVVKRDNGVVVLLGDNSEFQNLAYEKRKTNHHVGPFLDSLQLHLKGPARGWNVKAGPEEVNKNGGYSETTSLSANVDLGFSAPSGSAGWSQSKSSSTWLPDIKFTKESDNNSMPIFGWSVGNVYPTPRSVEAYESPWSFVNKPSGQVDIYRGVHDAPALAQRDFRIIAFASFLKTQPQVLDQDFKTTFSYEVAYRTVFTKANNSGSDAEQFAKGFGTIFGINPDMYSGEAFRTWGTVKIVNKFDIDVVIPAEIMRSLN